ncbi:Smr domain-containing protein [Paramyrothecium foliicola]|nr:Smr domain-containing protein [Paramyrothecium foliicola]
MTKEAQLQKLVVRPFLRIPIRRRRGLAADAFKPSLDEALILVIASDYDNLEDPSAYDAAYSSLQSLAQNALAEEATGFNPSGTSGSHDGPGPAGGDEVDDSSADTKSISQQASQTQQTESSNTDSSHHSADSAYVIPRLTSFSDDSKESKIGQLQSLFPHFKEFVIRHALDKANDDFQAALDNLLYRQELESTGQLAKGVDGFFQPDESSATRKKGKKKGRGKLTPPLDFDVSQSEPVSTNQTHVAKRQDEISYIADRFDIPYNDVSAIYFRRKYSAGATVAEILEGYIAAGIEAQDEASKKEAQKLAQKYRNVPEHYLPTLVHLTSLPQFSDDLAALLSKHFAKNPWTQKLDLRYSSTPLPHHDIEGSTAGVANKPAAQSSKLIERLALSPVSPTSPRDLAHAWQLRDMHHQARRDASASATQLAKSSSPLMRQGAGFYAERAREHGRSAWQATSDAADLQVANNSSRDVIDLHGVYVQDGVRIALQKTREWYSGLGEYRMRKAKAEPFTVITGVGRHSAGGVSQMRKAVAAGLLQDGWKMEIEGGKFVITGRR